MTQTDHRGALDGILVADFSRVLAGPMATMFLADLGATVIKVERPGVGDDTRGWGPPYVGATSTYYTVMNRNKQSLTLDLTDSADAELARRLAGRADVLVENFRPGRLAAFGLDEVSARRENPELVYCSISGFGRGPGADLPGYDFIVQAMGGLMSLTGSPDGPATKVGVAVVDVLASLHAVIGILAALRVREESGLGQVVEVNLFASLLSSLINQGASYINGAGIPSAAGNQHPSIVPYETLRTADAELAVAVGNDRQFAAMAIALGRPELAEDDRFRTNASRVRNRAALVTELESVLVTRRAAEWTRELGEFGVPCGLVNNVGEAIKLADRLGLDPVVTLTGADGDIATMANPLKLSSSPVSYHRAPPALGQDNAKLRAWLTADPDPVRSESSSDPGRFERHRSTEPTIRS